MAGRIDGEARHIELDLDPASETISGSLTTPERSWDFYGWLELASALDRLGRGERPLLVEEHPSG